MGLLRQIKKRVRNVMLLAQRAQPAFSKAKLAEHSYELLNQIMGDFVSVHYLHHKTNEYEALSKAHERPSKFLVHYRRNTLRLLASASYRYTETYRKKIKFLEMELTEAKSLYQRMNGRQMRMVRHIFEHEVNRTTQEPHSPEDVEKHLKNVEHFLKGDLGAATRELAREVCRIRDLISKSYPGCGAGIERWKLEDTPESSSKNYGAATLTAGNPGFDVVSGRKNDDT